MNNFLQKIIFQKTIKKYFVIFLLLGVLGASFYVNFFGVAQKNHFQYFQKDSENLVYQKIKDTQVNKKILRNGGFLLLDPKKNKVYTSQFGLQGILLSQLWKIYNFFISPPLFLEGRILTLDKKIFTIIKLYENEKYLNISLDKKIPKTEVAFHFNGKKIYPENITDGNWEKGISKDRKTFFVQRDSSVENVIKISHFLFSMLLMSSFGLFFCTIQKKFGKVPFLIVFLFIFTSPWILLFARNLYWVIFLDFYPFVFSWYYFSKPPKLNKIFPYCFWIFGFIFLKSLCGYEYISNVIISGTIGYIYFELEKNRNKEILILNILKILFAGGLGFLMAIVFHSIQGAFFTGNLKYGVNFIVNRFLERTYFYKGLVESSSIIFQKSWWSIMNQYFHLPIFNFGKIIFSFWNILILYFLNIFFFCFFRFKKKLSNKIWNLFVVTLIAFFGSFSWAILAKGHMMNHLHINAIIFYEPFLLTLMILWGVILKNGLKIQKRELKKGNKKNFN